MAVFQTFEDPPKSGRTSFENMGCTEKRRVALRKIEIVKTIASCLIEYRDRPRPESGAFDNAISEDDINYP